MSLNPQLNDRLLTTAFEEQIKLVDQSIIGDSAVDEEAPSPVNPSIPAIRLASQKKKKEKRKSQQFNEKQDSNLIFTNRSRKFRIGEDSPDQSADTNVNCIKKVNEGDTIDTVSQESARSQTSRYGQCIIPPPVDLTKFPQVENLDEAHSSMLMSWYMAGYHTGYFQAMKKLKE